MMTLRSSFLSKAYPLPGCISIASNEYNFYLVSILSSPAFHLCRWLVRDVISSITGCLIHPLIHSCGRIAAIKNQIAKFGRYSSVFHLWSFMWTYLRPVIAIACRELRGGEVKDCMNRSVDCVTRNRACHNLDGRRNVVRSTTIACRLSGLQCVLVGSAVGER